MVILTLSVFAESANKAKALAYISDCFEGVDYIDIRCGECQRLTSYIRECVRLIGMTRIQGLH